jgi:NADPH:quinone reductase-like Zn-dependent oxidoreductase
MKAAVRARYGPPDVVRIAEVEKPTAKDNQVLVKVHATTVNRTDCGLRAAKPFITKDDQTYDVVLDAVAKSSFGRCRRLLKPGGITSRRIWVRCP